MGRTWLAAALGWLIVAFGCGSSEDPVGDGDAGQADGPLPDAGPTEDGGQDASTEKDGAPVTGFCSSLSPKAAFCDDFDDNDADDDWTILTENGGIGALNETSATSVPASFTVQTQELITGQNANVHLRTSVKGTPSRVRLAFNAFFQDLPLSTGAIAIATLDVSPNHWFTLFLRDQDANAPAATLEETTGGTAKRLVLAKAPPPKVWTRIAIDIDMNAGTATVTYNSEKVLDAQPVAKTATDEPTIRIGAVYVFGPFPEFEARFDDVALSFP